MPYVFIGKPDSQRRFFIQTTLSSAIDAGVADPQARTVLGKIHKERDVQVELTNSEIRELLSHLLNWSEDYYWQPLGDEPLYFEVGRERHYYRRPRHPTPYPKEGEEF